MLFISIALVNKMMLTKIIKNNLLQTEAREKLGANGELSIL